MVEFVGYDEARAKKATCSSCGAIYNYYPKDVIILWSGHDYSGGSDGAKGFKCQKCDGNVITESW